MRCKHCGLEYQSDGGVCPGCGAEPEKIQVLTPEERENFQGITLEDNRPGDGRYEYQGEQPGQRVFVHQLNWNKSGFLLKLLVGLVLIGLIIFALPLVLLGVGVFVVGWFSAWLRKR